MEDKTTSAEENKIIESLFDQPAQNFNTHLNVNGNERILFSGPYGSGKTTFLDYFFNKTEACDQYEVIHLFPVNYSVSVNEDIFRYNKFDIIYSLLLKKVYLNQDKIPISLVAYFYLMNKAPELLSFIASISSEEGKIASTVIDKVTNLFKGLTDYDKAINNKPMKEVEASMQELVQKEGSIYEDNAATQLINRMLEHAKEAIAKQEEKKKKQFVLIIDDLDRIDPHHIFRLFNVFAAHFDKRFNDKSYKFGFDKVIFVCEINNIRNIFQANYGAGTDFSGYIDKFYSQNIFYYNIREAIINVINPLVENEFILTSQNERITGYLKGERSELVTSALKYTLSEIVLMERINLRTLFKFRNKQLLLRGKGLELGNETQTINFWQLNILIIVEILLEIFNGVDQLELILQKFERTSTKYPRSYDNIVGDALILLTGENHNYYDREECYYEMKELGIVAEFTFEEEFDGLRRFWIKKLEFKSLETKQLVTTLPHYLYLLNKCVVYLRSINHL